MSDFEDTFGAGVDVADGIDGICAEEDRYAAREDATEYWQEVIEHRLWFPDYASAEKWEKSNLGVPFMRRRHQGGFEVTLQDRRNAADARRESAIQPELDREGGPRPVTLVHAEGLGDRVVRHGAYSVRLAKETSSLLVQFLGILRNDVPAGRAALNPIALERRQFNEIFRAMPSALSHELEMGLGVMAVFCEDHYLVAGRRIGKDEIRIWPWLLEIECGGGKPNADGTAGCFLCEHHELEDGNIRINTHYDLEAFNYRAPANHRHYITKDRYVGDRRPRDLARCVADWIGLLSPLDQHMDATRRAPSSVIAVQDDPSARIPALDTLCDALACAIASRENINERVMVFLRATTDFQSLTQAHPDGLVLSWEVSEYAGRGLFSGRGKDRPAVPDVSQLDLATVFPEWRDLVDLYPTERPPRSMRRSGGKNIASGSFTAAELSGHQKMEAAEVMKSLLASDLPSMLRQLVMDPLPFRKAPVPPVFISW